MIKRNALICVTMLATATVAGDTTYTVVKHDNLWNLSEQYLGNPFYWPQIWNINNQIKNPNLIYPGDKITIPAELATQAAQAAATDTSASTSSATPLSQNQIESGLVSYYLNRSDLYSIATLRSAPYLESVSKSADQLGKITDKSRQIFGLNSIVTIISTGNHKFSVGEQVDITHTLKTVVHNNDKQRVVIPIGSAIVTKVQGDSTRIRITEGWDIIRDGDIIENSRPFSKLEKPTIDLSVTNVSTKVLVKVDNSEAIKPFHTMILENGKDNEILPGDLFIATAISTKGGTAPEPAFRGIIIKSETNSSTLLVEEVRQFSSSDKFVLTRVGRLTFH